LGNNNKFYGVYLLPFRCFGFILTQRYSICILSSGNYALYAISVRQLIALHSKLPFSAVALACGFAQAFRTVPHGSALAFG